MPSRAVLSEVIRSRSSRDQELALHAVMHRLGHEVFTDKALRAIASELGEKRRAGNRMMQRNRLVRASEALEPA